MQFRCHYCKDWYETDNCEQHFETYHSQKKITIQALEKRLSMLGFWETRKEAPPATPPASEISQEDKPRNWMFRDDPDFR